MLTGLRDEQFAYKLHNYFQQEVEKLLTLFVSGLN